jgi:glycosyltransferase involved in cell wall biosynthesis
VKDAAPRVVLVTGAYHPQISGGAVQCRTIARALADRVRFTVLTTATDAALPSSDSIDGVPVYRVQVDAARPASSSSTFDFMRQYLRAANGAHLVHVHGVSRKNVLVSALTAITRTPLVLTLHTAGQDEPDAIARHGAATTWSVRRAARIVSVSPYLTERYRAARWPDDRLVEIPNGIDTDRFIPASATERQRLKQELGFRCDRPLVLFVGFFSRDKRPDLLFEAWSRLVPTRPSTLAFVGAKGPSYYEIDPELFTTLRDRAARNGLADHVRFVDPTPEIEKYYRAADCYVLSSRREAMPLALLEAMACGLPVVATRLANVTDRIVTHGENGLLVDDGDDVGLTGALEAVLAAPQRSAAMGTAARAAVMERFGVSSIADRWLELYRSVLG